MSAQNRVELIKAPPLREHYTLSTMQVNGWSPPKLDDHSLVESCALKRCHLSLCVHRGLRFNTQKQQRMDPRRDLPQAGLGRVKFSQSSCPPPTLFFWEPMFDFALSDSVVLYLGRLLP